MTQSQEELREEFYKEFGHLQVIKNEISGNQYKPIADWWLSKLSLTTEKIRREAYKDGYSVGQKNMVIAIEKISSLSKEELNLLQEALANPPIWDEWRKKDRPKVREIIRKAKGYSL